MRLQDWNALQLAVAMRYGRRLGLDLVESLEAIAKRFADKHSNERNEGLALRGPGDSTLDAQDSTC